MNSRLTFVPLALTDPCPNTARSLLRRKPTTHYVPRQNSTGRDDSDGSRLYYCLLLDLLDANLGRFRRIGTFNGDHGSERDSYMEWYGHKGKVPSSKYDETTGKHVIYIVYAGNILAGQEKSDSHEDVTGHKGAIFGARQ